MNSPKMLNEVLTVLDRMSDKPMAIKKDAYIETFTGKKFYLFGEIADSDIDWIDIAHALSMQCRYNGHCNRFYSVAEHSTIMSHILPKEFALYALIHDGSEAYLSDIPSPFKPFLSNYKELEMKVQTRIYEVAGLKPVEPDEVREVDRAMLLLEAEHLLHSRGKDWTTYAELKGYYDKWMSNRSWMIWCWSPERAREMWLKRFYQLMEERKTPIRKNTVFGSDDMFIHIPPTSSKIPQKQTEGRILGQDIENLLAVPLPVEAEPVVMLGDEIPDCLIQDDKDTIVFIHNDKLVEKEFDPEKFFGEAPPNLTDEQIAELDVDPTNSIDDFLNSLTQKKSQE